MTEIIFADNTPQEMRDEVSRLAAIWRPQKRSRLVQLRGINDADYMTQATTILGNWRCPLYQKWYDMFQRIYSVSNNEKLLTYKEVEIHPDWLSFMNFRNWCVNNGWRSDYQLDKDFISDSKIYGPDTCVFIPARVNTFITDSGASRGKYPIGVTLNGKKFQAHCSNASNKKYEYIGTYNTPEEAHSAWKQKKHEHALALADMYPDLDPRVLDVLRNKYKPS